MKVPYLVSLVKKWEKEYEEHLQLKNGLRYFVFNPSLIGIHGSSFTEFSFESVKSFKNVFFPEKEDLMKKIQFFLDNRPVLLLGHMFFCETEISKSKGEKECHLVSFCGSGDEAT